MTEKTHERDVMERLELKLRPFVRELQYYFNGHTSINTDSDFLVFNIKELMNLMLILEMLYYLMYLSLLGDYV